MYRLRRIYLWLLESLNRKHHVLWNRKVPIEDCFWSWDHTLHLLWASWRSQCKRTCSLDLCTGFCRYKDILQMHHVNSSHQDGKSSASCMLRARNRSDKTSQSCHLVVASKLNQDGTWLKVSNYGITWNASWGCLAWGRTVLLAPSKSLGSYVRAAQQNHEDHIPCSPNQHQNPHCVRKWQFLSGACFNMALVFLSFLMVFTIQSVCGHRVSMDQVQWFKLPRLDDAMMLYALRFGMNRFHSFVAKICIFYGFCLSWI